MSAMIGESLSVTIQGENSQRILPRPARGGHGGQSTWAPDWLEGPDWFGRPKS